MTIPRTLIELLRGRAEVSATAPAFTFLEGGGNVAHSITAGELDRRARGIAVQLREHLEPGDRAVLLCLPGLDFVCGLFGCFYAGIVAVPTFPPDPARLQRTLPRMLGVLADTGARAVVATEAIAAFAPLLAAHAAGLGGLRWIATDEDDVGAADAWRAPDAAPHGLALLQYTSGSTGEPKGVMLTHANLLANSALIQRSFGLGTDSVGMSWLPPHHDMGLVGGILQPIFTGFPMVLMSPLAFLEQPARWLEAVSRFRVTCSGGPNFAFELCISRTTAEQRAQLDLRSWDVAFSGAEHVRAETLERFAAAFEPSGFRRRSFYPCYGLGEATLIVTGGTREAEPVIGRFDRASLGAGTAVPAAQHAQDAIDLVSCGRELAGHALAIVDPDRSERCGEGRVGEIWVDGRSVGRGYWQRPVESQRTFRARLRSQRDRTYLRTGDLGFVRDGELYMVSRAKDVIRIRGRSYWPQDLELAVERSHPALRRGCGAAFAIDDHGEEQLAIVQEVGRRHQADLDLDDVLDRIRAVIAEEHGLPIRRIALLRSGTIPKTTSGKIQRRACRDALLAGSLSVIHAWQSSAARSADSILPRLPEEEQLARIFCEVLNLERVGVHEPFFDLGGQSVTAAAVVMRARDAFGIELPMRALFETPTIAELAIVVAKLQCAGSIPTRTAMTASGDNAG